MFYASFVLWLLDFGDAAAVNLGSTYLIVFLAIVVASLGASVLLVTPLRWRGWSWRTVLLIALPVWLVIGFFSLEHFQQRVFTVVHRLQNASLPREGCLSYEPSFGRLYASYSMSRTEFDRWVAQYPVKMEPYDNPNVEFDAKRMGFENAAASYATSMAANGKQMRVYYAGGVMYVSYNVM